MTILLTNINENILNQDIIKESFSKLEDNEKLKGEKIEEITEIFYLNERTKEEEKEEEKREKERQKKVKVEGKEKRERKIEKKEKKLNFKNIKVNKFEIAMDKDMEEVYSNINQSIRDILKKKEFLNVIVNTSFLGYIILEILIKNFNITDVFILDNDELKKAHPCGCGPEYMGY